MRPTLNRLIKVVIAICGISISMTPVKASDDVTRLPSPQSDVKVTAVDIEKTRPNQVNDDNENMRELYFRDLRSNGKKGGIGTGKKGGNGGGNKGSGGKGRRSGGGRRRRRGGLVPPPPPPPPPPPGVVKPELVNFDLAPFGDDPFFFINRVPIDFSEEGDNTKLGTEFVFFETDRVLGEAEYFFGDGPPYTGEISGTLTGECQVVLQEGVNFEGVDPCVLHCTWCIGYEGEVCAAAYGYAGGKRQLWEEELDCFPVHGELTATGNIFLDIFVPEDTTIPVEIVGAGGFLTITASAFDLGAAYNGGIVVFEYDAETDRFLADWKISAAVPFNEQESCDLNDAARESVVDVFGERTYF